MNKRYFITICTNTLFLLLISFATVSVEAVNMRSPNYHIIFGNINSGGNEQNSTNYRLDISLGQALAERFSSSGYIVKAGFQYIHILYPFAFSISNTSVNFGTVLPNTFSTQAITLTVTNRGQGYEIKASEETPLRRLSLEEIPDTECNMLTQCNETSANVWDNKSAYGFGYNISGTDKTPDFIDGRYFRPFAAASHNENPITIMESAQAVRNRQGVLTMKINISPIQQTGTYQTVVNFIAVPKY